MAGDIFFSLAIWRINHETYSFKDISVKTNVLVALVSGVP
jgi:hypothetical protein